MAVYELKDVRMTKSGESVDFVSGVLLESELEGQTHYDLTMKNVLQYELFLSNQQNGEPVQVEFTTIHDEKGKAQMEVRSVNKQDINNNIVELVTQDQIEFK